MKLPSVTRVLAPWSDFSGVSPEVLAAACARGTEVHACCAAVAVDQRWACCPSPEASPYVESFERWFDRAVEHVEAVEVELVDAAHGYCGHPDLICRVKGDSGLSLVDLKTPATKSPLWRVQLAAYAHLARVSGFDVKRIFSLRLKRDGSNPILDEYTETAVDFAAFVNTLNAFRYFKGV